mmetsp:Transcript_4684/g.11832  ORF Transcript_4684/g.11832 Transcript_4684/m.11832 type:complete len:187 (+) Transcript_4684:292-852(+)
MATKGSMIGLLSLCSLLCGASGFAAPPGLVTKETMLYTLTPTPALRSAGASAWRPLARSVLAMSLAAKSPKETFAALKSNPNLKYLDVRTPEEFAKGHPTGAVNIPAFKFSFLGPKPMQQEFLAAVREAFPNRDVNLAVGCAAGSRSRKAAEWLAADGYSKAFDVLTGFSGWQGAGLPVETLKMDV